jgi:hypothetical protein
MIIHSINDLSNSSVVELLTNGLSRIDDSNYVQNYHPDFSNIPGNLFYILKEGRYKIGNYFVMEEDGKYIGSAGWNRYNDVALVLTRAYIPPELRSKYLMATYLLPIIFEQTTEYNKLWITSNNYNKVIYDGLDRLQKNKSNPWPDIYRKFVPIGMQVVNNTLQYVAEYQK